MKPLNLLAFLTILVWPVVPLFWIPVHGLSRFFKRIGLLTYIMPPLTWIPIAYLIFKYKEPLLNFRYEMPVIINIAGLFFTILGTLLHLWTGKLLGLRGLMGIPEVSKKLESRLVSEGPFKIIRHPTYLAHTILFFGIFLLTEVITVGILTIIDFLIVNLVIIPLEEKELSERFRNIYSEYRNKVRYRFFPGLW
ncbi:MAG: methyltransferase [Thermodesulfovibrionales bacterium]